MTSSFPRALDVTFSACEYFARVVGEMTDSRFRITPFAAGGTSDAIARVVAARTLASRFAQMASLKTLLADRLNDAGWTRMRPPMLPLPAEEAAALLAP